MGFLAVKSVFDMYYISPTLYRANEQAALFYRDRFHSARMPSFPALFTLPL